MLTCPFLEAQLSEDSYVQALRLLPCLALLSSGLLGPCLDSSIYPYRVYRVCSGSFFLEPTYLRIAMY